MGLVSCWRSTERFSSTRKTQNMAPANQIILKNKQTNKQTMYIIFAVHQEHIFTCLDCDNILETSASLEKHIENNHPAQCAQCQDEFRFIFLVFQFCKVQPPIQLAGQRSFLLLHKKDDGSIDQQSNKAGGHLFQMWYFSCFAFLHLCSS